MYEGYKLEVPDFASITRCNGGSDPTCVGANDNCNECCQIATNPDCRSKFGLDMPNGPNNPIPTCECQDLCVQKVKLICPTEIYIEIPYPPVPKCRLGNFQPNLPPLTPGQQGRVFIVCAEEELDSTCSVVKNEIRIVVFFDNVGIPVTIKFDCTDFFRFPQCTGPVSGTELKQAMADIDGSCKVINLRARASGDGQRIIVEGKVIDKLWKEENVWVVGIQPFELSAEQHGVDGLGYTSDTFKQEFTFGGHNITNCP